MMSKKDKLRKQRHQVKSRWYYIFWGTCTVAVCAGQVLVGSGFRRMADSLDNVLEAPIVLDFVKSIASDPPPIKGSLYSLIT